MDKPFLPNFTLIADFEGEKIETIFGLLAWTERPVLPVITGMW